MKNVVAAQKDLTVIRPILGVVAVMFLFGLSLLLWKMAFVQGDWAVIALLPLFFMVYTGCYQVILRRRRAILLLALRPESYIGGFLKGKISSFIISFVIAVVTTVLLAFEAITISFLELVVLSALCLLALSLYKFFTLRLNSHFNDSFLPSVCTRLSVVLSGLVIFPVYAWVEFNYVTRPGYFRALSLVDTIKETLERSATIGGSITNEILSIFYVLDSIKLWLVVQAQDQSWVLSQPISSVYVVYDAIICFLVARSIVAVAAFFQFGLKNWRY